MMESLHGYPVVRTEVAICDGYNVDVTVLNVAGVEVSLENDGNYYNVEVDGDFSVAFTGYVFKDNAEDLLKCLEFTVLANGYGFEGTVQYNAESRRFWFLDRNTWDIFKHAYGDQWNRECRHRNVAVSYVGTKTLKEWAETRERDKRVVKSVAIPLEYDKLFYGGDWIEG